MNRLPQRIYNENEIIYEANKPVDHEIGIITSGRISIHPVTADSYSNYPMIIGELEKGSLVGETAILNYIYGIKNVRTATVKVLEKTTIERWALPSMPWNEWLESTLFKEKHFVFGNFLIANIYFFAYRNFYICNNATTEYNIQSPLGSSAYKNILQLLNKWQTDCKESIKEYLAPSLKKNNTWIPTVQNDSWLKEIGIAAAFRDLSTELSIRSQINYSSKQMYWNIWQQMQLQIKGINNMFHIRMESLMQVLDML
ncbi:MAG: hypothetical protein A2Y62_03515 [Candidatus Fischerbacteria bacterium RBG_13_37_8]|uniref:Cyclic nucleotide-binding domain-containing protein n=1 Tax=Candidatus Fischerbacteria bacterium RBG_13_37_8 TaxID=1817863 RepID=A0A1F5VLE5_9BACT|nr:MAG: hypothetical protein A2Y62_03515 [Candidatus Fischerbacteria bacterium RBG_13_37_8]